MSILASQDLTPQETFTAALPTMEPIMSKQFLKAPRREREELLQSARVAAWCAWYGMVKRGIDPATVSLPGIAFNAARSARARRRQSAGPRNWQADVMGDRARRDGWERCTVVDYVGSHDDPGAQIDFDAWLASLPIAKRRVAELLAVGNGTFDVANELSVSPGRVSQIRRELYASWQALETV